MKHSFRTVPATALAVCIALALTPAATPREQEKVYKMGPGVTAPSVLFKVDPDYTAEARDAKISGPVLLKVVIGSDGVPRDIQVLRGLDPGLDAKAKVAVELWKFQPATKDGQAVSVTATIEVNFRLE